MKLLDIAKYRLLSQQLTQSSITTPVEMVEWFGAVQAQEYSQTKWSLGLRLLHVKDEDIEADFTAGNILRTHLLRPTWHFVTPKDIRWMLMLTGPRIHTLNSFMYRKLELNTKIFNRCNDLLIKSLRDGRQLTRDAINKQFKKNKIEATGHRLSYIMMQAELDGIICSGPRQGNQFTYALLAERVPKFKSISHDEALGKLAERYFTSRGPATIKDFSTWSGLTFADCKKGIEVLGPGLEREIMNGAEYYFQGNSLLSKKQSQKIFLLPIYDEFIMGYKDRSAIMVFKNKYTPAPVFLYDNMILFKGQVSGTWRRIVKSKSIQLQYDFLDKLNKGKSRAFKKAVNRYEEFNNLPVNYVLH